MLVESPQSSQAMPPALQFLVLTFAGWVNRHQDDLIAYLREALLRGSKTDPQRPLPTDPLTTDSVRRQPTKLSHLIEDVTCEDGLRLLPRPTARSKALPDDQLVPEEGVLHTGLLMVARVLLPLSPSSLLHLSDRAVARGAIVVAVQTRWLSWSVE